MGIFRSLLNSFRTACAFLTILPIRGAKWEGEGLRFFNLMLPVVGALLGVLWVPVLALISRWDVGPGLKGAASALALLALTGGLHMDGLMDTCDALLSRRDRETRLKILSDTHAGSFAVMGCAAVLLLQAAALGELLTSPPPWRTLLAAATLPAWSRLGLAALAASLPFVHQGGLASILCVNRGPGLTAGLTVVALLLTGLDLWAGAAFLPPLWLLLFLLWRRCCLSAFGGITGDPLGAFAELSETLLLLALAGSLPAGR